MKIQSLTNIFGGRELSAITLSSLWQPAVVAPLIVVFLSIYWVIIDPRPYLVSGTDTDHDYYSNALLILDTGFPGRANHPGIPLYYLTAVFVGIGRLFNASPQVPLNIGYLAVGGMTAASFAYFFHALRNTVQRPLLWASLAILLSWPTIVFYLSALASDTIAISLSIASIAYFWQNWIVKGRPTRRQTIILAMLFGTAMSLKLTVLPVIAVTWLVVAIGVFYKSKSGTANGINYLDAGSMFARSRRITAALAGPVITLATFLVLIAPALGVFPLFLRTALGRTASFGSLGPPAHSSTGFVAWYAENAPIVAIEIGFTIAVFVTGLLLLWLGRRGLGSIQVRPNLIFGGLFSVTLLLLFIVGMFQLVDLIAVQGQDQPIIANSPSWNLGFGLRQLGPSFSGLVVMMLFTGMLLKELKVNPIKRRSIRLVGRFALPVISIVMVIVSISIVAGDRRHQTDGWQKQILPGMEVLASDPSIEGRTGFGMTSNGMSGIFELWGDIRYSEHREKAIDEYSNLALFDLKIAAHQVEFPEKNIPHEYKGVALTIQNMYRSIPKILPPFRDIIAQKLVLAADDLIRGPLTNESVGRIAYLVLDREATDVTPDEIKEVLIREFGPGDFYETELFGRRWEVFDVAR